MTTSGILDTRCVGKPSEFHGDDDKWTDFAFVLCSYCGLLDPKMPGYMSRAKLMTSKIPMSVDVDELKAQQSLYHLLVMLCKNRAL